MKELKCDTRDGGSTQAFLSLATKAAQFRLGGVDVGLFGEGELGILFGDVLPRDYPHDSRLLGHDVHVPEAHVSEKPVASGNWRGLWNNPRMLLHEGLQINELVELPFREGHLLQWLRLEGRRAEQVQEPLLLPARVHEQRGVTLPQDGAKCVVRRDVMEAALPRVNRGSTYLRGAIGIRCDLRRIQEANAMLQNLEKHLPGNMPLELQRSVRFLLRLCIWSSRTQQRHNRQAKKKEGESGDGRMPKR